MINYIFIAIIITNRGTNIEQAVGLSVDIGKDWKLACKILTGLFEYFNREER